MPSPRSPEDVLWNIFPLLLIVIALVGGIIFLPKLNQVNLDDRSRASEPTKMPTKQSAETPEIICSDLYEPVCGSDSKTYSNSCEANLAKITRFTPGECQPETPISLPNTN